jgi:hypothetical protein
VRSILRFAFVVVPTAALAGAVVFAASTKGDAHRAVAADGDLQRDLQLASASSLELAPTSHAVATVSPIEAPSEAAPERATRPKRSSTGTRALRSRKPVVHAAPEPEVAAASEEAQPSEVTDVATSADATAQTPAGLSADAGGVALPRPTAVPVSYPAGGGDSGGGGILGGIFGAVIRGGGVDGDHCQIHRGNSRPSTPPIYRQPIGGLGGSRIRERVQPNVVERSGRGVMDRVRANRRR